MAGRRTLRSGKEYSEFDLAFERALAPPIYFDVSQRLREVLVEQDVTGLVDEADDNFDDDHDKPRPFWLADPPSPSPSAPSPEASLSSDDRPLTAAERDKNKFKARRAKRREEERVASDNPLLKGVHRRRLAGAKSSALQVEVDISELPHTKRAWTGLRDAQPSALDDADQAEDVEPPRLDSAMGGTSYTQAEVDALSGTVGFIYIPWLGKLTVPLLDSHRRVIAVLGGTPRDDEGWKAATDRAARLLLERISRIRLSDKRLHHRRAQDAFPAIARGLSHGGGQTEPGELCNNISNTELTDELLADPSFDRLSGFANMLLLVWAPLLSSFYQAQMALLAAWNRSLRWNFAGSVFAACTFNFGPQVFTAPHVDFANLAWGWCAITALGTFDPDLGGHLILWDLKLVIRFPPGSTILLPSALITHSNVPIQAHEHRSSFTQYTAGGLFRWVRNGFRTDEDFECTASKEERQSKEAEHSRRWEDGVNMFSNIDDL